VGACLGDALGALAGALNGEFFGANCGDWLGAFDGDFEGALVGAFDGDFEGALVGAFEGDFVGELCGDPTGEEESSSTSVVSAGKSSGAPIGESVTVGGGLPASVVLLITTHKLFVSV
jgi:hypothetical protein